jgi:hypothetical protein
VSAADEVPGDPVEVAPPPRAVGSPVSVVAVKGGYQVWLNRRTAERLADALAKTDEKQLAAALRDLAKDQKDGDKPDEATAAKLELAAFVVSSQLPGFKAALAQNMGPGGVVITFTGLQAPTVKFARPRPVLERAAGVVRGAMPLMPAEAREAVEALRAVARTTPLLWTVEPRE